MSAKDNNSINTPIQSTPQQAQTVKAEGKTNIPNPAPTAQQQPKTYKILNNVEELQSKFNTESDKYKLGLKINNTDIRPVQVQDVF